MEIELAPEKMRLLNRVSLIPLILICALAASLGIFQQRIFRTDHLLKQTDEAIKGARRTQALLLTMESGFNSYVVTRRKEFLTQYTNARNELPLWLEKLHTTVKGTGGVHQYQGLNQAFRNWVSHSESLYGKPFAEGVKIFETTDFQRQGNIHMADIRNAFDNFINVQMKNRDKQLRQIKRARENFILYGTLLMVGVALYLAWFFRKQLKFAFQKYETQTRELEKSHNELRSTVQLRDLALKSRDDFISIASHELNTPLTSLKLQVQMLKRDLIKFGETGVPSKKLQKFLDQEDCQINRLVHLVEDMLAITRLGAGALQIRPVLTTLDVVVSDVVESLQDTLAASGSVLSLEIQEGIRGQFDRERVEQILLNLVTNAIKYGQGRPIHMRLSAHDGWARIEVSDQGRGLPVEAKERIFRMFERNISASEVSGLGLGLFITRQLVEAHHGHIWVESPGEGMGSTFIVEMPLHPANEHAGLGTYETINEQWHQQ